MVSYTQIKQGEAPREDTDMKFFEGIRTLEELKTAYRSLVKIHHPDMGGDEKTMKAINAEFESVFEIVKNRQQSDQGDYSTKGHDIDDGYREVLDMIIHLAGIRIEICGSWIWLTGDTYAVRDSIKAAGFKWAKSKKAWYWHTGDYRNYGKKKYTLGQIRMKYGSESIRTEERFAIA